MLNLFGLKQVFFYVRFEHPSCKNDVTLSVVNITRLYVIDDVVQPNDVMLVHAVILSTNK